MAVVDLAAFTNPTEGVGAGILDIYAVKKSDVVSIPAAVAGDVTTDILLAADIDMVRMDFDREASSFRNPSVGTGRSQNFLAELMFKVGGSDTARNHINSNNINNEFVLLVKLGNGLVLVVGDIDKGAIMSIPESTTGENGEDDHMERFMFKWSASHKCYTYSADIPVPTGV